MPSGLVTRAHIVLMAAKGMANNEIAKKTGISYQEVSKWRQRYLKQRISGLHDELRPGRPRTLTDELVATIIRKTLDAKPKDATHWTIRSLANETPVLREAVHRIWNAFGLQTHRQRRFKLSTVPFFLEKSETLLGYI